LTTNTDDARGAAARVDALDDEITVVVQPHGIVASLAIDGDPAVVERAHGDARRRRAGEMLRRVDHRSRAGVLALEETQSVTGSRHRPEMGDAKRLRHRPAVASAG